MKRNSWLFWVLLVFVTAIGLTGRIRIEWPQTAISQERGPVWTELSEGDRAKTKGTKVDPEALNSVFTGLTEQLSPAVVSIYTRTRIVAQTPRGGGGPNNPEDLFRYFFGNPYGDPGFRRQPPRESQGMGSGFVINAKDGFVVTNAHVIRQMGRNADQIMVKFLTDSEKFAGHPATVVGVDELTDVAVLKLKTPPKNLRAVPLGDSDKVRRGEWVLAIGNPLGHTHTVTQGIVSAIGRSLEGLNRASFIQTDAGINQGNSGGPLFNLYGEVIGINTAIDARGQGIGFSIPINIAKNSVRQLIEKGEVTLGFIGAVPVDLNEEIAQELGYSSSEGALIESVVQGQPAARGGLRPYDIVIELNGRVVESAHKFRFDIGNMNPGSTAKLKVVREGKPVELSIVVGKRPSQQQLASEEAPEAPGSSGEAVKSLGINVLPLTPPLRARLGLRPETQGVLIVGISESSPAAGTLSPEDLILEVNQKPVKSAKDIDGALKGKRKHLMKVQRGTASLILLLDMRE